MSGRDVEFGDQEGRDCRGREPQRHAEQLRERDHAQHFRHAPMHDAPCTRAVILDLNQRNLSFVGGHGLLRVHGELRHHGLGQVHEGLRAGGIGFGDHDRNAAIAADADRLVERQPAEERDIELVGHLLAAAMAEDVGLVMAVRALVETHVLHEAERRDLQLLIHAHRAAAVGERHLLRRRHDDRAGGRHRLAE